MRAHGSARTTGKIPAPRGTFLRARLRVGAGVRLRVGLGVGFSSWVLGTRVLAAGVLGACLLGACGSRARHPFFARAGAAAPGPIVFAHRGGGGLLPEETLPTLLAAVARDPAAILEFDVHRSRDGHIVLLHDDTVDRTTNGRGRVADLTLAELKALDAGYCATPGQGDGTAEEGSCGKDAPAAGDPARFPFRGKGQQIATLDEVLAAVPPAAFVAIEVKEPGFEAQFAAAVRAKTRLDRLVTGSENDDIAVRLKDLLPEVAHYMPRGAATCFAVSAKASFGYPCPEYEIFAAPLSGGGFALDTRGVLDSAHRRGLGVVYWTINDEATMERLARLGADGIFTDYPDRARRVNQRLFGGTSP